MKIAWILVLSMMMISCGRLKPKAETKKDTQAATAGDENKAGTTSEQITVCEAYQDLVISHVKEIYILRDDIAYKTTVKPAISSVKLGTCHLDDTDWVELDSKIYEENMPKPESDEYKTMKAACASLKTSKAIVEFAKELSDQIKTLKDPQAKGLLIARKSTGINEEAIVYKCSTDFGVYQPAKIVKTQTKK